jgi:hypothetical protein
MAKLMSKSELIQDRRAAFGQDSAQGVKAVIRSLAAIAWSSVRNRFVGPVCRCCYQAGNKGQVA